MTACWLGLGLHLQKTPLVFCLPHPTAQLLQIIFHKYCLITSLPAALSLLASLLCKAQHPALPPYVCLLAHASHSLPHQPAPHSPGIGLEPRTSLCTIVQHRQDPSSRNQGPGNLHFQLLLRQIRGPIEGIIWGKSLALYITDLGSIFGTS